MIKKCIGCGVVLQDQNEEELGYTPNLNHPYCMRCFRLKNYGEKKEETLSIEEQENILKKVNKKRGLIFFLIDFFNLNQESLNIFKKIKLPKILVISKSDIIRKEIKFTRIKIWLKKVYHIKEEIIFISNKNDDQSMNLFHYLDEYQETTGYIMGVTNVGKSTYLNRLLKKNKINKEIIVSDKPNTTLDFIKIRIGKYLIYDTPGFNYGSLNEKALNQEIKPITYNIKRPTTLSFGNLKVYVKENNSVTLYSNQTFKREYKDEDHQNWTKIEVKENSDLILPRIGYLNIKRASNILHNGHDLEIRPNISGEEYE